ncbi:MAG: DUF1015 domain-containing protein, partial [Clostridia bacterium]|nr:DUF1015 domain-containing protein [Clostridia bacterium]
NMEKYLANGIFRKLAPGIVLTERTTRYTEEKRYGVVLAVDLEEYSFASKSEADIRASEATVPERIPPRVKIRQGAKLELPHVMLLYNAKEEDVLGEAIAKSAQGGLEELYDFELNRDGGHLRGWFLPQEQAEKITENLYAATGEGKMLFAVGDGNHSLATAKTCWEEIKKTLSEEEQKTHPARYALCEAVSIYSPALTFEPIYRFVAGGNAASSAELIAAAQEKIPCKSEKKGNLLSFIGEYNVPRLLRALDGVIAEHIKNFGGTVDYVHGKEELAALVEKTGGVGFLTSAISKDAFFASVEADGALPRKTFSMGEGEEKRYYTECKEI